MWKPVFTPCSLSYYSQSALSRNQAFGFSIRHSAIAVIPNVTLGKKRMIVDRKETKDIMPGNNGQCLKQMDNYHRAVNVTDGKSGGTWSHPAKACRVNGNSESMNAAFQLFSLFSAEKLDHVRFGTMTPSPQPPLNRSQAGILQMRRKQ